MNSNGAGAVSLRIQIQSGELLTGLTRFLFDFCGKRHGRRKDLRNGCNGHTPSCLGPPKMSCRSAHLA